MTTTEALTINAVAVQAGDLILLGEKAANQLRATDDARIEHLGKHAYVVIPTADGGTLNFHASARVCIERRFTEEA